MSTLQFQFLILILAGWVNRTQQDVIEYLQEENRVFREQLGEERLLFTDVQRRRLAAKAKKMGRKGLFEINTLVTPDTLLRWYRRLIALALTARRRRWPSVKGRRPSPSGSRSTRFSASRYSMTSCWVRLTHPAMIKIRN